MQNITESRHGFEELGGIAVDKDDKVYLIDCENCEIFKFNQNYKRVKTTRQPRELKHFSPSGISVCREKVLAGSRTPPSLYIFHMNLELDRKIKLKGFGIGDVTGIANDDQMSLYICDYCNGGVHVLSLKGQGELLYTFGKE